MHSLIFVFAILLNWAGAEEIIIGQDIPVYQATSENARILFTLHAGESVETQPSSKSTYYKIRVKRGGKWRAGFVQREALDFMDSHEVVARSWGVGLSYVAGRVTQKGKSFTTTDQVQYTTTEFAGGSGSPMVIVQFHDENFWRFGFGQKSTAVEATAHTNVGVSNDMLLAISFWSLLAQKAWTPLSTKNIYFGVGVEAAKAHKMELKYGATTLKTSSQDYPLYIGVELFVGFNAFLSHSLSIFAEGRIQQVFTQSPPIQFLEGGAGLIYWP